MVSFHSIVKILNSVSVDDNVAQSAPPWGRRDCHVKRNTFIHPKAKNALYRIDFLSL